MSSRQILAIVACAMFVPTQAVEPTAAAADARIMVDMPAAALNLMRQDMLSHLAALNAIIAALGNGDQNTAADIAEKQLGRATMGRHQGTGMGPGRSMPMEMRNIGWRLHDSADAFAAIARKGDAQKTLAALEQITTSCVSCHAVYRTR